MFKKVIISKRTTLVAAFGAAVLALAGAREAEAVTIRGTYFGARRHLLSGSAVNVTTNSVLTMSLETLPRGFDVQLCAGSMTDFDTDHCATELGTSDGNASKLIIVDAESLNGKVLFTLTSLGSVPISVTLTVE